MMTTYPYSLTANTVATQVHAEFKRKALSFIGSIYRQRKFLEKHKTGLILTDDETKLFRYYKYYGQKWTSRGISAFLLENKENIEKLIPGNKAKINQLEKLYNLIETAKTIQNEYNQ